MTTSTSIHATASQILHGDPWLNVAEAYDQAFRAIDAKWYAETIPTNASRNLPAMLFAWHRDHKEVLMEQETPRQTAARFVAACSVGELTRESSIARMTFHLAEKFRKVPYATCSDLIREAIDARTRTAVES